MPRDFSRCGEAINRHAPLLMRDPARHCTYLETLHLPIRTVLVVPFSRKGRFVGTIWTIGHTGSRSFDTGQQRTVEDLATFASAILDSQEQ